MNQKQDIVQTVNQYGQQLLNFIRGKVPSEEDAEDVLQDVWFQLLTLTNFDAIESVSGWLYKVAKNKITDRFRKKKTENLDDFSFENEDGELIFKDILLADPSTPEGVFFKNLFWDELMEALRELPENQRTVFIKNELEDESLQDIATETGENLKTIISRKGYATKHLRKRLHTLYNDFLYY